MNSDRKKACKASRAGSSVLPKSRERWLACSAVAVVFLLVLFQLLGPSALTRHAGTVFVRNADRAMAAGQWDEAIEVCQLHLLSFPLETRAHFLLARCYLEQSFPDLALMHLVLATAPQPPDGAVLRDGAPSHEETRALLDELQKRHAPALNTAWGHLRQARLARVLGDTARFARELEAAAAAAASVDADADTDATTAPSDGVIPAVYCEAALTAALGAPQDGPARVDLSDVAATGLTLLLGTRVEQMSGACPLEALIAGGAQAGGGYTVWSLGARRDYGSDCGWLFEAVDTATGAVVGTRGLSLMPLTNEDQTLRQWIATLPPNTAVVGFASGEALAVTSQEARTLLSDSLGLKNVPAANAMTAYVFACLREGAVSRVFEQAAAAPDVPAVLILRGGRP